MTETEVEKKKMGWALVGETLEFKNDHLAVATEKIRTPTCREASSWTVVRRKSAVVIAPITAEGKFVLILQERIPIRQTIWELPAGQVDELCDTGSIKEVALRELREETGYELTASGKVTFLGDFFSSPGFTDERAYLFTAQPVRLGSSGALPAGGEKIVDCREFTAAQLQEMIACDEIRDANTLAVFARLTARGLLPE